MYTTSMYNNMYTHTQIAPPANLLLDFAPERFRERETETEDFLQPQKTRIASHLRRLSPFQPPKHV